MASTRSSSRRSAGGGGDVLNPATIQFLDATRLRKELEQRGLDTVGAKNTLADRLQEAVELEKMGRLPQATVQSEKNEGEEVQVRPSPPKPVKSARRQKSVSTAQDSAVDSETPVSPIEPETVAETEKVAEVVKTPDQQKKEKKKEARKRKESDQTDGLSPKQKPPPTVVEPPPPPQSNKKKSDGRPEENKAQPPPSKPVKTAHRHHTTDGVDKHSRTSQPKAVTEKAVERQKSEVVQKRKESSAGVTDGLSQTQHTPPTSTPPTPITADPPPLQSDKQDGVGRPEQSKTRPPAAKPVKIAQRHQASANVLDSIFDKQSQMLKPKTETEKAADRQRIEMKKRRESNASLTYGLGPMQKPAHPTVVETPPPPPPPPRRPSSDSPGYSLLPPPPPPPGLPPLKRIRTSDDVSPTGSADASTSKVDASNRPSSRDRVSAVSTPGSESSQSNSATAVVEVTSTSPCEKPPSGANTGSAKESDPDKMQKVFSVLSAVFAAKLGIVLPTPTPASAPSMEVQESSGVTVSDDVGIVLPTTTPAPSVEVQETSGVTVSDDVVGEDEPVEQLAQAVEPMDEDENEVCAAPPESLVSDALTECAEIEPCATVLDIAEQSSSTEEPPTIEELQVDENASAPATELSIASNDLMKDPRALLDRASAVLQQMQQRKQIKEELDQTIQYEQVEPDPDCEAIEEEKPLPHFHGEPVPEDMDDEEAIGAEVVEVGQAGRPRKRNMFRARRVVEEEPQLNEAEVQLDFYNSDLHLKPAQDNRYQVDPENKDGFALMWGGIKASYGVRSGKVAYQVKIIEFLSMNHLPFEETDPHDLRIGWSETNAPYQLGEAMHSYAFCSVGRKAHNNVFAEYGQPFHQDDVITCCLDYTKREISYYKNGESMGVAFADIPLSVRSSPTDEDPSVTAASSLGEDLVFFPHVATKNCKFEVNLGQQGVWGSLPDGFRFMNDIGVEDRIRGPVAPANKSDCTVLMMVGLPGVGKTTWVRQYLREHVQERWTVLNAETIMAAMKVNGVARRRVHQGRWDMIMGLTAKALTRSLHLACRRRKNYIIDQTNVAKDSRRKKLGQFREFQRKCVVIIPDDDEFVNRQFRQAKSDGTGPMPVEAMLELKAVFSIPNVNTEPIEDVHFVEPPANRLHEAFELVNKYNQEARPWYQKRYRGRPPIPLNNGNGNSGGGRRFDSRRSYQPTQPEQSSPVDWAPPVAQAVPSTSDTRPLRIIHEEPRERHSSGEEEQAQPSAEATIAPSTGWASTQIAAGWDRPAAWANRGNEGYAGFGDSMPPSLLPPPPKEKPADPPATANLWAERKQQQNVQDSVITLTDDPVGPSS